MSLWIQSFGTMASATGAPPSRDALREVKLNALDCRIDNRSPRGCCLRLGQLCASLLPLNHMKSLHRRLCASRSERLRSLNDLVHFAFMQQVTTDDPTNFSL
eukprot:SAG31_NODE_605_length_13628_cov_24.848030_17_plen_102_part_00